MLWRVACVFVLVGVVPGLMVTRTTKASSGGPVPAPASDNTLKAKPAKVKAVFAGGCFWGTQAVFERLKGVVVRPWATQAARQPGQPTIR